MKVLVGGDWHSDLHEAELCNSLRRIGHQVYEFKWFHYFSFSIEQPRSLNALLKRFQNKFIIGSLVGKLNKEFINLVLRVQPDVIFIYRGTHITVKTLTTIRGKLPYCKLVSYNNDDPFSPKQPRYLWRHFIRCIPFYDLVLAYRHANLEEFKKSGAQKVALLRSWYVPDRSFPVELSAKDREKYSCDVVFIGHYEPDERLHYLEAIVRRGYRLRLFGPYKYWKAPLSNSKVMHALESPKMVWGEDYNKALCGARIALCFLSKLNRDTYTRRCFEIPATRTLMLSEYSDDLASLYIEGVEADYFRNESELVNKIEFYLKNPEIAEKVAQAGFEKVQSAGYDIDTRIKEMLKAL